MFPSSLENSKLSIYNVGPPIIISWFIKPMNYSYIHHKPWNSPGYEHQLSYHNSAINQKSYKIPWNTHFPMVILWFFLSWERHLACFRLSMASEPPKDCRVVGSSRNVGRASTRRSGRCKMPKRYHLVMTHVAMENHICSWKNYGKSLFVGELWEITILHWKSHKKSKVQWLC